MAERLTPLSTQEAFRPQEGMVLHSKEQSQQTQTAFLRADDVPDSVQELGIFPGERSWLADAWDNLILGLRKAEIVRVRQEANEFWNSHFTPERMANRFQIPRNTGRTVTRGT